MQRATPSHEVPINALNGKTMSTPLKLILLAVAGLLLLLTVAACSPLRTINALTPRDTYVLTEDISYGTDPRDALDIYAPANVKGTAPVVVFFYGGSWSTGSRKDYRSWFAPS